QQIHESDMLLLPDPSTAFVDPFRVAKTLALNFFIHDPFTREAYSRDPRNVAKKAETYLASSGIADTAYFGAEAEFYVFDSIRHETAQNRAFYYIDSIEGAWNSGKDEEGGNRGYKTQYKAGYFPVSPVDHYADLRDAMVRRLIDVGFTVTARWYIGGLLHHAPSLLAFTNPTVNSYRRLVPGFEAPVNLVYSQRNRSACTRIPVTGSNPKAKRVEFRVPDPSSNPYLSFSAMLMAGLDGIKNKIEPPQPIDKDLYDLPPDEYASVTQVPGSLDAV